MEEGVESQDVHMPTVRLNLDLSPFKSAESEGTLKNETGFDSLKSCHKFPELHLSYNLITIRKAVHT